MDSTFLPVAEGAAFQVQSPVDFIHADFVGTNTRFGVPKDLFYTFNGSTTVLALEDASSEFGTDFTRSGDCSGNRNKFSNGRGTKGPNSVDER